MSVSANQKPVVEGTAVLSNGDLAVLAGNLYQPTSNVFGFDDLQVAILANSTPDSLNQTTGTLSFASGGDSPNNSVAGGARQRDPGRRHDRGAPRRRHGHPHLG